MDRIKLILLIATAMISFHASSQLKGKTKHLIGKWEYKQGSGFEIWSQVSENELEGSGYRRNKLQDSVKVEELNLRLVNSRMVYTLKTQSIDTTSRKLERIYVSDNRKLMFESTTFEEPRAIRYRFGFFNRNKLKITIYSGRDVKQTLFLKRSL